MKNCPSRECTYVPSYLLAVSAEKRPLGVLRRVVVMEHITCCKVGGTMIIAMTKTKTMTMTMTMTFPLLPPGILVNRPS